MHKQLRILLIATIVIGVLVGCKPQTGTPAVTPGAAQTKTARPSAQETAVSTPAPEISADVSKLKGLQIQFLHPWTGDTAFVMAQMVDQFNQTNEWGIHVIVAAPGSAGQASQKFFEGIDTDQPVDLVAAPVDLLLLADEQYENILDLNPYVASTNFGFGQAAIDDFLPAFWQEDTVAGKRFGIPAQRTAGVIFYNLTRAEELGITSPPETTSDFQKAICAANASMKKDSDSTNDGLGGWITNADPLTMLSWLTSFDAVDPLQPIETLDSEESTAAFAYLLQLLKTSCAWNSRLASPYDYFASQQALAYSGTLQDVMLQSSWNDRSGNKDEWKIIAYPADDSQKLVTSGFSYGIVQSDPEQQLASWLFIRWLSSPQNQARLLKTSGTLPLSGGVLTLLDDFKTANPQWDAVIDLLELVQPQTAQSNGEIIKTVLEDAGWQLYKTDLKPEQIPTLIEQIDAMIEELTGRTP